MGVTEIRRGDLVTWTEVDTDCKGEVYWTHQVSEDASVAWIRWETETSNGWACHETSVLTKVGEAEVGKKSFTAEEVGELVGALARAYWVPANTMLGMQDPYPNKRINWMAGAWAAQVVEHLDKLGE